MDPQTSLIVAIIALGANLATILTFVGYSTTQRYKKALAEGQREEKMKAMIEDVNRLFERIRQLEENHHINDKAIGEFGIKLDSVVAGITELKTLFKEHTEKG